MAEHHSQDNLLAGLSVAACLTAKFIIAWSILVVANAVNVQCEICIPRSWATCTAADSLCV